MMKVPECEKDERAVAVENAGYSLVYKVMTYALLVDVLIRSLVQRQSSWDLMGILILGGAVAIGYQAAHKTVSRRGLLVMVTTFVVALVIAAVIVLVRLVK